MNLVVFDIDGTLTRSEYQHQLAFVNAMKLIGISNINESWKEYKHHTDSFILKANYEDNFATPFDLNVIDTIEREMTHLMSTLAPITELAGAGALVNYLRNGKNYAVSFATGSLKQPTITKLEQAKIWHDQQLLASSNHSFTREEIVKEAIEKAQDYYEVPYFDHIISIGDGIWDLQTAKNLNLSFIGVGVKNYNDFKQANIQVYTESWVDFDFDEAEKILLHSATR